MRESSEYRPRSGGSGPRGRKPAGRPGGRSQGSRFRKNLKKRGCRITSERKGALDFKDVAFLVKFISDKGKIFPRSFTGACAKRQRELARAIKKARAVGLLKIVAK
jgi:small subunit ribosomal protein S18